MTTADTDEPRLLNSLPERPLPLSLLLDLEDTDRVQEAVALMVGGRAGDTELMTQFLVQTDDRTYVLSLPVTDDDGEGWSIIAEVDGGDDDAYSAAVAKAKVWREERGIVFSDEQTVVSGENSDD